MLVFVNDQPQHFQENSPQLAGLLKAINLEFSKGIAIAVNGQVISKNTWSHFELSENDKITLIQATQGG